MQVPNREQEVGVGGMRVEDCQIIGGYASHGWSTTQAEMDGGDDSSFLLNMTQNLRFRALANCEPYQTVDQSHDSRKSLRLQFGRGALCIGNDFQTISSKIGDSHHQDTKFVFGDGLTKNKQVDSLIPGTQNIPPPVLVEVWTFSLRKN